MEPTKAAGEDDGPASRQMAVDKSWMNGRFDSTILVKSCWLFSLIFYYFFIFFYLFIFFLLVVFVLVCLVMFHDSNPWR